MLMPEILQWPVLILLQSVMVGLLAVILFKLTEKLFNTKTATTAAVIFLLNPWMYWYVKMPMTTIAQGLFYVLFIFSSRYCCGVLVHVACLSLAVLRLTGQCFCIQFQLLFYYLHLWWLSG